MDGNGRWAKQRGLPRKEGHKAGTEAARAVVTRCRELGVSHLTLYTFSKENWSRPVSEVQFLFDLLGSFLSKELATLMEQSIRLMVLGELEAIPFATRQVVRRTLKKTAANTAMTLNLALNYSGRDEIVRAVRKIVEEGLSPDEIDEAALAERLYTVGQPDPDLIIRTSGELRLSNYLLFQAAYSEFYFTDTLWPDFGPDDLDAAIAEYNIRKRRFGRTDEQLTGGEKDG